jgi:hypothetical protein
MVVHGHSKQPKQNLYVQAAPQPSGSRLTTARQNSRRHCPLVDVVVVVLVVKLVVFVVVVVLVVVIVEVVLVEVVLVVVTV